MLIYLQMMDSTEDKDKFEAIYLAYRGLMAKSIPICTILAE